MPKRTHRNKIEGIVVEGEKNEVEILTSWCKAKRDGRGNNN